MAELTVRIKPDDIVERVIDEATYKGKTIREWADLLTNPKTNADRIRAMSDEELADYLAQGELTILRQLSYFPTPQEVDQLIKQWISWLQSSAGGDGDG